MQCKNAIYSTIYSRDSWAKNICTNSWAIPTSGVRRLSTYDALQLLNKIEVKIPGYVFPALQTGKNINTALKLAPHCKADSSLHCWKATKHRGFAEQFKIFCRKWGNQTSVQQQCLVAGVICKVKKEMTRKKEKQQRWSETDLMSLTKQ